MHIQNITERNANNVCKPAIDDNYLNGRRDTRRRNVRRTPRGEGLGGGDGERGEGGRTVFSFIFRSKRKSADKDTQPMAGMLRYYLSAYSHM